MEDCFFLLGLDAFLFFFFFGFINVFTYPLSTFGFLLSIPQFLSVGLDKGQMVPKI